MTPEHTSVEDINIYSPSKTIIDRYLSALNYIRGKDVLDFGCGSGHGLALFYAYGAKGLMGVDINTVELDNIRKRYKELNIKLFSNTIPIEDNSVDVITCFEVFEHIKYEDVEFLLKEFKRIVKEDGIILFSTPINTGHVTDPFHINEMTYNTLVKLLNDNCVDYKIQSTIEHMDGKWFNTSIVDGVNDNSRCFLVTVRNKKGEMK